MDRDTIDFMVTKFKDNLIGEYDNPSINKLADTYSQYYRQGIEDTLKILGYGSNF